MLQDWEHRIRPVELDALQSHMLQRSGGLEPSGPPGRVGAGEDERAISPAPSLSELPRMTQNDDSSSGAEGWHLLGRHVHLLLEVVAAHVFHLVGSLLGHGRV